MRPDVIKSLNKLYIDSLVNSDLLRLLQLALFYVLLTVCTVQISIPAADVWLCTAYL